MKSFFKLCLSVVRRNNGAGAGIFVMALLSAAIAFLGANFGAGSSDTVMSFLEESGTPDAVYVTELLPYETRERIEQLEGVRCVSPGFVYDTNIETGDGTLYSVRAFRMETDSPYTNTVHESVPCDGPGPYAAVSVEFAEYNGIHAGDSVSVSTPLGKKKVTVASLVSGPETMNCVRDEFSAYESYRFAYLYFSPEGFDALIPAGEMSNRWLIYFDSGLSADGQKECMLRIREVFSGRLLSETFTDESDALKSIREDLGTISVLCSFIPCIIWLICLGFNFIFIRIIVENRRKTVGLLRALGFSARRCVWIFVSATVLVSLPGLLCGVLGGTVLLRACLGLIAAAEGILDVKVTVLPVPTVLMLLAVLLSGVLSALLSARSITAIDPAEACGGARMEDKEPPRWIGRLKAGAFFKISLASAVRNRKRQVTGALCIAACVICMCVGFEGVYTIGHPIDAVYGGRYRYDLSVRGIGQEEIRRIESGVTGLERAEPVTLFTAELCGQSVRVSAVLEDSHLTVLADADGNRLAPGDGVIIDEMFASLNGIRVGSEVEMDGISLRVNGIAREILYTVQYVSSETAARLGYEEPNCVLLKLNADTELRDAEKQVSDISGGAYFAELASQKQNIRDGFKAMRTVMLMFAVLAFGIGSLLVINITLIDFGENRVRYAALRALGTPVRRLGAVAAAENLFRVLPGIVIACPLCGVCVDALLQLLSNAGQQYVPVNYPFCLILSCLIPVVYVLFGMGIALYRIGKMNFSSVLNEAE